MSQSPPQVLLILRQMIKCKHTSAESRSYPALLETRMTCAITVTMAADAEVWSPSGPSNDGTLEPVL